MKRVIQISLFLFLGIGSQSAYAGVCQNLATNAISRIPSGDETPKDKKEKPAANPAPAAQPNSSMVKGNEDPKPPLQPAKPATPAKASPTQGLSFTNPSEKEMEERRCLLMIPFIIEVD